MSSASSDRRARRRLLFDELDLLHADPAVSTVLLQHSCATRAEALREVLGEVVDRAVQVGVRAPAQLARVEEDFLGPHLQDRVGMGAHPYTLGRDVTQHGVEFRAIIAASDGIHPHERAVESKEPRSHLVGRVVVVRGKFRDQAHLGESIEDGRQPRPCWRRFRSAGITTEHDGDPPDAHAPENTRSVRTARGCVGWSSHFPK
jgi:hypothetical protein